MNVTDQWMMQQMQQIAAGMAAPPQTGQNADAPKTEQGESFRDLMDKAKDQKADTARKDDGAQKTEGAQKEESDRAVQGTQTTQAGKTVQKVQKTFRIDPKTGLREIDVTPEEAALLVAGYAKLSPPMEDGTVWLVTVQDENGDPVLPLAALEGTDISLMDGQFALAEGEWVLDEITPEFTQALEQLLQRTNDPRSVEDIIGELKQKMGDPQLEPVMEVTVRTGDEEDFGLDAGAMTAGQPLFHDVKAAPVKVGENFRLDTEDADMDANLADTIRFAAQQGLRQVEIKLSPENLGSLTVRLTQASDGTLQVVLHAANQRAVNLLNQHLGDLNAALQGQGSEVRVEVQRNEDSQQSQQQQQQADPNGHNRQQQQQRQRRESEHSGDFVQRLRLGLFGAEETT